MKENEPKLEKLFRIAREAPGVAPPETFADQVMSQVTPSSADNTIMIDFLLPKLTWAAAFVIAAFLTSEVIMNANREMVFRFGITEFVEHSLDHGWSEFLG